MRITLLQDTPLRTLMLAMRDLDSTVKRQIGAQTKRVVLPVWQEETRLRGDTRLRSRLAQSATVGVTAQNITLKAGTGPVSSTVSLPTIAKAVEFGNNPHVKERAVSKRGKVFQRRRGNRFGAPSKTGHVVYPAARDAIPRIVALWVQTAARTIHETIEKAH